MRWSKQVNWLSLSILILIFIAFSIGLAYLSERFLAGLNLRLSDFAPFAYLITFGVPVIVNLSILPLPFAISLMIAAATKWNPVLVALSGSLGACIGELSGYYLGALGKRLAISDEFAGYKLVQRWIDKYGIWAIAFLSFQPIIPIEIGGFVAGAARMPVRKFLPALWLGKFPKYLILIYAGASLINFLH